MKRITPDIVLLAVVPVVLYFLGESHAFAAPMLQYATHAVSSVAST